MRSLQERSGPAIARYVSQSACQNRKRLSCGVSKFKRELDASGVRLCNCVSQKCELIVTRLRKPDGGNLVRKTPTNTPNFSCVVKPV